jgi:hypothetical protein
MKRPFVLGFASAVLASVALIAMPAPRAQAEDFFSALFRGFAARRQAPQSEWPLSYGPEQPTQYPQRRGEAGSGSAYCVRTCDGRYFPAPPAANQSRADICKSFCPASETKVFYGAGIDSATSESGKSYSALPNAFKYRSQLIAGCTCNGVDPVGLAKIKIEDDKTLRRGDLVAAPDGLKVATGRSDAQGAASLDLAPARPEIRARFERRPSVAAN